MILFFTDRRLNVVGQASTHLPKGLKIVDDMKTEDVDTGIAVLECTLSYSNMTEDERELVSRCATVGNYILRQTGDKEKVDEFYTIIESEEDTKSGEISIYAEDAGLDLLNEIVGGYEADKAYNIAHYINKFAYDTGFVIGINEVASLTRKLKWEDTATITERLLSVATQFDGCEISFSFNLDGFKIQNKFINIHKRRGKDLNDVVRLNKEVDSIVTTKSIANLATALRVTGGTPEAEEPAEGEEAVEPTPITLDGYSYDDGDFFLEGTYLKSREAVAIWSRYLAEEGDYTGHICKRFEYDTIDQAELCTRAIAELKKLREIEVNYEVDITRLPESAKLGDRINIVDDAGSLYLSARILKLEISESQNTAKATLGEYLIKNDGISQRIAKLAEQFEKSAASSKQALFIANNAKTQAKEAQTQAQTALDGAVQAQQVADNAKAVADAATESAANATAKADAAEQAVGEVEENVASIEKTVDDANAAAEQARQAAATAEIKASEAQTAAIEAKEDAADAKEQAGVAKTNSETAISKADGAKTTAEQATTEAAAAKTTAEAAKLDAEQAEKDVAAFGEDLTTLSNTMQADYARKTELTETESSLQSQISQNAEQIQSTVTQVTKIDETANNAAHQASQAQQTAAAAQQQADKATEDAEAAQQAADAANLAASNAQSEADKAKAAAATAQGVADKAEEDLAAAKADLATVQGRVDATEEEIAAAQQAVETAQAAADKAKADAADATAKANAAQGTADTAVANAATAQTKANEAAQAAALAQQTADGAKGDAAAAKKAADDAAAAATAAQNTANTAKTNAETAQTKANEAAAAAAAAQSAADDADAKAAQAAVDLATAQQNLENVTGRVDATEEEIAAAQAAVEAAQAKADEADAAAAAAQSTADTAKANAAQAQTDADNAKTAADNAQAAADAAQQAADDAQAAVDALAVRVTKTETDIIQTSEQIKLLATKEEVTQTLGGYSTKEETQAAIDLKADEINLSVSEVREEVDNINIGGRNLLINSSFVTDMNGWNAANAEIATVDGVSCGHITGVLTATGCVYQSVVDRIDWTNLEQTYVFSADVRLDNFVKGTTNPYLALYFSGQYDNNGTTVYAGATTVSGSPYPSSYAEAGWVRLVYVVKFEHEMDILNAYIYARDFTGDLYFKNLKLEKGNKATDWTPAPEDYMTKTETEAAIKVESDRIASVVETVDEQGGRISTLEQTADGFSVSLENLESDVDVAQSTADSASTAAANAQSTANTANSTANTAKSNAATAQTTAENAAKTATNFMSYDSTNGLLIGNKSSGLWSGYRTQITSSEFNILNSSGSILASYGANTIYLGKNDRESTIDMCNGLLRFMYDTELDCAKMLATDFYLSSDDGFRLYATKNDYDSYVVARTPMSGIQNYADVTMNAGVYNENTGNIEHAMLHLCSDGYALLSTTDFVRIEALTVNVWGDFGVDGDMDITGQISGPITSSLWVKGRDHALLRSTSTPSSASFLPLTSLKTTNGSWEMGTLNNMLYFSYATDANYEMGNNTTTKITFNPDGHLILPQYATYQNTFADGSEVVIAEPYYEGGSGYKALIYGKGNGANIDTIVRGKDVEMRADASMRIYPYYGGENNPNYWSLMIGVVNTSIGPCLRPFQNGYCSIGANQIGFKYIYATNTGIQSTSDARLKENVSDDFSKLEKLFGMLHPVTYEYKHLADDDDIRIGFIAQDVWSALETCGYDPRRFAAIHTEDVDPESDLKEFIDTDETYYLNYTEFTALNTYMIQKLMREVSALKDEISELKGTKTA